MSDSNNIPVLNPGLYKNLLAQVESIYRREAICFEIITDYPEEITREIIERTGHSTTLIPAKGMYSGKDTNLLICVVNKTQAAAVIDICRSYSNTFTIMDPVGQVVGNFKNMSDKGKEVVEMLDSGDGKTL